MICNVIGIAQQLFEIQDGGQVLCTVSKFKAFSCQCAFENVGNRIKMDLVTQILLNAIWISVK